MSPYQNQATVLKPTADNPIAASPTSSFAQSSSSFPTSLDECKVCGDRGNNRRYGVQACLGCTVFFRRAVSQKMKYQCLKSQNCVISHTFRCACRYCRFQKCLRVGMQPSSIQRRDVVGPRRNALESPISPDVIMVDVEPQFFLADLVNFQRKQFSEHLQFFSDNHADVAFHTDKNDCIKFRRRARFHDVNVMMKLSLKQASEWGSRLKPFRELPMESKKSVLAEYCIAFLLIDHGFKTSKVTETGIWLLQNGSFIHPDYFFGFPAANPDVEHIKKKTQIHRSFVTEILQCVIDPFRQLQVDEVECAALKTILLLSPSCSKRAIYAGQEDVLAQLHSKCMEGLMDHSVSKFPHHGAERFGQIILLLGGIRCGVKTIYNQTRVSDLFNVMTFDPVVKDILLV